MRLYLKPSSSTPPSLGSPPPFSCFQTSSSVLHQDIPASTRGGSSSLCLSSSGSEEGKESADVRLLHSRLKQKQKFNTKMIKNLLPAQQHLPETGTSKTTGTSETNETRS